MRAIGQRYQLARGIQAEVYFSGTIILVRDDQQEKFDQEGYLQSSTDHHKSLFAELGVPPSLLTYITVFGRPIGTLWND